MFEQELYDRPVVASGITEGDLFSNYEIKNWVFTPRIYKILAISAIANILAIVVIGQTNLLTMRGCDSPWVGSVCQVLDTVYVGSMIFGTEREYVDVAYDRVDLGDAEITFIDVSNETPPLSYPEGYFQIANPVQFAQLQQAAADPASISSDFIAPGIPRNPNAGVTTELLNKPPVLPDSNPNAVKGGIPNSPFAITDNPTIPRGNRRNTRRPKPVTGTNTNTNSKPSEDTVADAGTGDGKSPSVSPSDPISGVDINKRPMVDLANTVNELREAQKLNLETNFVLQAKGKLNKDGRLDPKTFKYEKIETTDENMKEVLQQSIEAINVAGYLQYLKDLSGKDFNLLLQQDDVNISAVVQSEMESETRARSIRSGIDLLISLAKQRKTGADADQNDKDDLVLLENAKVETDGKKITIIFTVPKTIAHPMIQRKLAEQAAELKKPSGNADTKPNDNTARR